jgi:hypothetical protein
MSRLLPYGLLAAALAASPIVSATGEVYRWTDENGVRHYSDSPPPGQAHDTVKVASTARSAPPPSAAETPAAAGEMPAAAPTPLSNCEVARKNVETFSSAATITMDRDGDGTAEPLDPAQRDAELARNVELVRIYCE